MNSGGIIDINSNPFAVMDWINQGFKFTPHRQRQLLSLLDKSILELKKMNRNAGKYVAFVAIRWGFAEIVNDRLVPTDKWNHRGHYDGFGLPKQSQSDMG